MENETLPSQGADRLSEYSDQQLIAACLTKNTLAWETLVKRYQSLIYSIPLNYGFSLDEAGDIFQSVCMVLLEKLAQVRNQSSLRSWLITTVVRQCWQARQRRKREAAFITSIPEDGEGQWQPPDKAAPADQLIIEVERQYQIEAAFAKLSPRCQQLIRELFFYDTPASYEEIAARLGLAVDSIGSTRCRCLERLRTLYERETGKLIGRRR